MDFLWKWFSFEVIWPKLLISFFLFKALLGTPWPSPVVRPSCCEIANCPPQWKGSSLRPPAAAAAAAKSLQSCLTLCDPTDGSPPASAIPGILQARTLEWVAISFSNAWKWKVKVKLLSRVRLFKTPRTSAYQAPPLMGFPRQEYWSGLPFPSPLKDYEPSPKPIWGLEYSQSKGIFVCPAED